MFISNTATAVLLAPIAVQSAVSMGISPYPLLLAVSVGTSMCFASPFSTPPNALVMPVGKYTFMDYVKVGVPLQVIMGLVMIVVIPLFSRSARRRVFMNGEVWQGFSVFCEKKRDKAAVRE